MKKILLITAGILTIVVLTGSLLLYLNREKIVTYATDRALTKVEERRDMRSRSFRDCRTGGPSMTQRRTS